MKVSSIYIAIMVLVLYCSYSSSPPKILLLLNYEPIWALHLNIIYFYCQLHFGSIYFLSLPFTSFSDILMSQQAHRRVWLTIFLVFCRQSSICAARIFTYYIGKWSPVVHTSPCCCALFLPTRGVVVSPCLKINKLLSSLLSRGKSCQVH